MRVRVLQAQFHICLDKSASVSGQSPRTMLVVKWYDGTQRAYDLDASAHSVSYVARHLLSVVLLKSAEERSAFLKECMQRIKSSTDNKEDYSA